MFKDPAPTASGGIMTELLSTFNQVIILRLYRYPVIIVKLFQRAFQIMNQSSGQAKDEHLFKIKTVCYCSEVTGNNLLIHLLFG